MSRGQRAVSPSDGCRGECRAVHSGGKTVGRKSRKRSVAAQLLAVALLILLGCTPVEVDAHADEINFILNSDFTLGLFEGLPPGWGVFSNSEETGFELSDEESTVGGVSLKLVDNTGEGSVGLRSHRVPAKPGQRFILQVDILAVEGSGMVYLDFHNARGGRIVAKSASVGAGASWETVTIEAVAPDETNHVTVILYSSIGNTGVAFFDNVRLYTKLP